MRHLLAGVAAVVALGAGAVVTGQVAPPEEAAPAPAPAAPPADAGPSAADVQDSVGEAPPSEALGPAPENDPIATAIENELTARSEAAATPAPRPTRRTARRPGGPGQPGAATGTPSERVNRNTPTVVGTAPASVVRPRYQVAVLQGLDKTTARTLRFEARVGRPVRYEGLVVTVRACERSAPEEPREEAFAWLDVLAQPRPTDARATPTPRQVYRGWMMASAPTVHPFGHPVYDLWLVDCRTSAPASRRGA